MGKLDGRELVVMPPEALAAMLSTTNALTSSEWRCWKVLCTPCAPGGNGQVFGQSAAPCCTAARAASGLVHSGRRRRWRGSVAQSVTCAFAMLVLQCQCPCRHVARMWGVASGCVVRAVRMHMWESGDGWLFAWAKRLISQHPYVSTRGL